jgi:proline dehydrogenase
MSPQFDNTEIAFKHKSDSELKLARFLFRSMNNAALTKAGIAATKFLLRVHAPVKGLIRRTIFRQFCGGENIVEAARAAERLAGFHIDAILDYGVEGKEKEKAFNNAASEFVKAITYASTQRNIPFVSLKITGFARFGLLEKIHNGEKLSANEAKEWQRVHRRIKTICSRAFQSNIMILIDAEETWIQEPVNELAEAMMELFNKEKAIIFNTYQLYSVGTLQFLKESLHKAAARGYILGAKLVRGAYMEKERARAAEKGYPDPIQPNKQITDRDFDEAVKFCLQNLDKLALFIGTHNEKSCLDAVKYMQQHHMNPVTPGIYFSQLYGMGDNISFNLAHYGYHVSKYMPYGPVSDVVPYLMRRAEENTSVAGQTSRELSLIDKEIKRRQTVG